MGANCEILTGTGFQWKAAENGNVPENAVQVIHISFCCRFTKSLQGGFEADALSGGAPTPLYVARGKVDGVDSIGKVAGMSKS